MNLSRIPEPKKSLGQHWLADDDSLQAMASALTVQPRDQVLEIGPGLGTLTRVLIDLGAIVTAVEFDRELARDLPKRVKSDRLVVVEQNILSFDYTSLTPDYKVVANIPYYLTSNLIRILSETPNQPIGAALLVQKEVAERAAAGTGGHSLLSISAQYYWDISLGRIVKAELFTPPPKVDSQILILNRRAQPLYGTIDTMLFFQIVRAGFSGRRKTLLNSLSAGLRLDKSAVQALCESASIDSGLRAQALSLDNWYALYGHMQSTR
jgi:16S rRNA (adenine1518-N6/adenine1519-N6)-dimethyltransferase